jgi:hypothetical protein
LDLILLHSAMQTGASTDVDVIQGLSRSMAPNLMRHIKTLEELDATYTRWLDTALLDPDRPSVMVTAHDLLSVWNTLQAELAANRARSAEIQAREYRVRVEAELRERPRQMKSIAPLLKRPDAPALPAPSEAEKPQEARPEWDRLYSPSETIEPNLKAVVSADQMAKEQRNRQAWYELAAKAEQQRSLGDKTEGEDDNGTQT